MKSSPHLTHPARILITGHRGFIGTELVRQLRHQPFDLHLLEDRFPGARLDSQPRANVVIHLASQSDVATSWESPALSIHTQLAWTLEVLEYCRKHSAHLIFPSTFVYDPSAPPPYRETSPVRPANPYALAKWLSEETCRFFSEQWKFPVTILRLFNVYGPGQPTSFLLSRILDQVLSDHTEVVRVKDLQPRRDFVHVQDVARALVLAISPHQGFRVFNVCSGNSHSVSEVVQKTLSFAGINKKALSSQETRVNEILDSRGNASAIESALGWKPQTSLDEGLRQWILEWISGKRHT